MEKIVLSAGRKVEEMVSYKIDVRFSWLYLILIQLLKCLTDESCINTYTGLVLRRLPHPLYLKASHNCIVSFHKRALKVDFSSLSQLAVPG